MSAVDFTNIPQITEHMDHIFGDMTTTPPNGVERPDHWKGEYKDWDEFEKAWRAWQRSIGFDPDDPSTW